MKWKVIVEPRASTDIEAAYLWLAEQAPENAHRWLEGLYLGLASLANFPERCPFAPENDFFPQEIRQLLYGKRKGRYRILFTLGDGTVHILHVRHGARPYLHESSEKEE